VTSSQQAIAAILLIQRAFDEKHGHLCEWSIYQFQFDIDIQLM
jgi:hypothetical protein